MFSSGKIRYYTHPPESHANLVSAEIVSTMSKEFDIDALMADQEEALQGKQWI